MNTMSGLLLVGLAVGLSGCIDYSTPEGVIAGAFDAIQKEKVRMFRRVLSRDLKKEIGNEVSVKKLKADFAKYEKLEVQRAVELSVKEALMPICDSFAASFPPSVERVAIAVVSQNEILGQPKQGSDAKPNFGVVKTRCSMNYNQAPHKAYICYYRMPMKSCEITEFQQN